MIYAIIAIALILLIALIVGLVKGFTRTKTWATEYLFTVVLSVLIYALADTSEMSAWTAFSLKIGTAVAFILVFALLSERGKALFKRCIAAAQKRSYYEMYGDREENKLQILDAIELGDRKAYKRLTKRKFKEKRGAVGVADRICGAITLMIKMVVVFGMIAAVVLVVLDFTQLPFVEENLGGIYSSGVWESLSKFFMDAFVIGIIFLAIRSGFRSGVVSVLWVLATLALIAGAAYLSFWLCFNVEAFQNTAASLNGSISGFTSAVADAATGIGLELTAEKVAQCVLGAGIFIILFIVLLIVGVVVSGIIGRAREGAAFSVVDGIFGAVVAFAVATFVLLFVGAVLYTLSDLEFMEGFNSYMFYISSKGVQKPATIASVFYSNNPLNSWEFIVNLPMRGWFN